MSFAEILGIRKLESTCGVVCVILYFYNRTDRRTTTACTYRASMASCGKNAFFIAKMIITSSPIGVRSIAMSVSACLSVRSYV